MARILEGLEAPLGRFLMAFANLEDAVTRAINTLMRIDHDEGIILNALMPNFSARIELFEALAQLHAKDHLLENSKKISRALRSLNGVRNNFVHDSWHQFHPENETTSKVRYKISNGSRKLQKTSLSITKEIMQGEVDSTRKLRWAVIYWEGHFRYRDEKIQLAALPEEFYDISPLGKRNRS
jgi:hypothetical protein